MDKGSGSNDEYHMDPNNESDDNPQVEANNANKGGSGSSYYPTWEEWQEWQRNDPSRFNNIALLMAASE